MRVYLAGTLPVLGMLIGTGSLDPGAGFAVTPGLRELAGLDGDPGDQEELEYLAFTEAARASLGLLAAGGDPAVPARRVVLAAEIDPGRLVPDLAGGPARVGITGLVRLRDVVSAHVDDDAVEPDIRRAIEAADPDLARDHELAWYATQELPGLLDGR